MSKTLDSFARLFRSDEYQAMLREAREDMAQLGEDQVKRLEERFSCTGRKPEPSTPSPKPGTPSSTKS